MKIVRELCFTLVIDLIDYLHAQGARDLHWLQAKIFFLATPGADGVQKLCPVLLQTMHDLEFFLSALSLLPLLACSDVDKTRRPKPKQELHELSNEAGYALRCSLQQGWCYLSSSVRWSCYFN